MNKVLKLLIVTFIIVFTVILLPSTKVAAYSEYDRIIEEVEEHIENGTLPEWHRNYSDLQTYQSLYCDYASLDMEYFAGLSEEYIKNRTLYYNSQNDVWYQILSNLNIPIDSLLPNHTLGLLFDGNSLWLLWTSEYIPNENLNITSVTVKENDEYVKYDQQALTGCSHLEGDGMYEMTDYLHIPHMNLQINKTPIMTYHKCDDDEIISYGIEFDGCKDFEIVSWTAGLDPLFGGEEQDPDGYYNFGCKTPITFNFAEKIKYGGDPVCQLASLVYIEITDCAAQSVYDFNFGGYKHYVYFNTNLDLEEVYRVDVGYTLLADDAIWTEKLFNDPKTRNITKSLNTDKNNGGLFNLTSYQGFKEGAFSSNEDGATIYKYQLMLNYDESNWEFNEWFHIQEADYKRVEAFQILRLNFYYHGEEFDMPIKMDTIKGETKKIYSRDLVLDTSSTIWKFKDTAGEITDVVVDTSGKAFESLGVMFDSLIETLKNPLGTPLGKAIIICGGCALGIVAIFYLYKYGRIAVEFFKKKK